jgi:hypothetical protein
MCVDFDRYPRTFEADVNLLKTVGVGYHIKKNIQVDTQIISLGAVHISSYTSSKEEKSRVYCINLAQEMYPTGFGTYVSVIIIFSSIAFKFFLLV